MSPEIFEIAKAKDDDLNYLDIEIYKDLEFWMGVGVPIIIFSNVIINNWNFVVSCFCFFFLWVLIGLSLTINTQMIERRRYSLGSFISMVLGIIIGIIFGSWLATTF